MPKAPSSKNTYFVVVSGGIPVIQYAGAEAPNGLSFLQAVEKCKKILNEYVEYYNKLTEEEFGDYSSFISVEDLVGSYTELTKGLSNEKN